MTQSCWLYFDNALEISYVLKVLYDEEEGEYIYYPSNNDIVLKTIVGDVFACDGAKSNTCVGAHRMIQLKVVQALFITRNR